jgi:chromosome segregation protein
LEALERDRVGLAPAAARLLKERQQFGDGAVLGPLSDFVTADRDAAVLVERFLGATVHAVVLRDRDVAERVRVWHASANLGPLLLLPADAIPSASPFAGATTPDGMAVDAAGLAARVHAAEPAGAWVRALLGGVEVLGEGAAFVDARGAVLLPGQTSGPGPLRRRAELAELRVQLEACDARREEAVRGLEGARAALATAESQQAVAAEASTVAQQEARRADDQKAELERRRQRAERELGDAHQLAGRLSGRVAELSERARSLEAHAGEALTQAESREQEAADARGALDESEHQLETAREERTVWQVEQAQAQARLQVAADRERRLAQELQTAAQRMQALERELSTLSMADSELAGQMSVWALDLQSRREQLHDVESRLGAAEDAVRQAT